MKRPRGTGSVYRMRGSGNLWIKYHRNGVVVRESAKTSKQKEAEKRLSQRLGEIATGTYIGPKIEKIRVAELADELIREYTINQRKSLADLKARWKLHLEPFFGSRRALEVTSGLVARYVDARQHEGAENATINRELAVLKRAFNLARRGTPTLIVPHIAMLAENNTRTGFVDAEHRHRLATECARIGLWLRAIVEVGYTYGWRIGELLKLRVGQVDVAAHTIRLEPGTTKNREGREVLMTPQVETLLTALVIGKSPDAFVFTRDNGKPVRDFRGSWEMATKAAGVPGLLFHDLRRSAARNLRQAGVAEGVIMKIGGWRTRSVFERYAIVAQSDIADAINKLASNDFGQSLGIVEAEMAPSQPSTPTPSLPIN